MSKLATVYGGSGFVGRYIVRRLAKAGWRVRVAVRRPNEAIFVKPYGSVGQVEPILCNIRNEASVRSAMEGADAVINCVGTFDKGGKNNFDAVQDEGAERIARIAADLGVAQLVHLSSIGADAQSETLYGQSKGRGENAILQHFPNAMILRPSIVFGPEDDFFNRFASMSRFGPVLPVIGAETKFQPVYVDDVAQAAMKGVEGTSGVFELGGPDTKTFRELMQDMLGVIRRRRLILNVPFFVGGLLGTAFDLTRAMTGGLIKGPVTKDQVTSLKSDVVVAEGAKGLVDLGVTPTSMEAILPSYLWRFRPAGQYEAMMESARDLRAD
ncbi:complex I NDUFA9 subunit family protein [Litoreibacter sp.]|nr:complex I NDUFA9 subunit family protein [Litoreibacter sp.]